MPSTASAQFAAPPMGIYERRHHQPLAWAGEPFRPDCGTSSQAAAPDLMEAKFEPALQAEDDALLQDALRPSTDSSDQEGSPRPGNKIQRRLAQNREAARKSRLRKKAYIQNLETSGIKLAQLEQELSRARQQGYVSGSSAVGSIDPGVLAFEMEYAHWVEEQGKQTAELRAALQAHASDFQLRVLVEAGLAHYDRLFRAKSAAARSDVFFVMSGVWRAAAERFFLWIGGFRPSELLKILAPQLDPLTEEQASEVARLRQTARQAEDAVSQGMDKLQETLTDSLLLDGQMAHAVARLGGLAGLVDQADHLRQQTLKNMYKILTVRQAARGLLALGDYCHRLRALSSLWAARPREPA